MVAVDSGAALLIMDMPRYDVRNGDPCLDFLLGINVHGAACEERGKPDIFVDVRRHMEWIQKHINADTARSEEL